jgi:alpha-amylase/alpha-mannosidase (GH57 family)
VTIGEYVRKHRPNGRIKRLASGSWIYGNFKKWIGSPQKNMAWEYLKRTREDLFQVKNPDKRALEELYIAEGSDWFWWYDEFGTELNFIFDELFRLHLANIYKIIGKKAPAYIKESICGKNIGSTSGSAMAGN